MFLPNVPISYRQEVKNRDVSRETSLQDIISRAEQEELLKVFLRREDTSTE